MLYDDPLTELQHARSAPDAVPGAGQSGDTTAAFLSELADVLERAGPARKPDFRKLRSLPAFRARHGWTEAHLSWACDLYLRVVDAGGMGNRYLQTQLLYAIGAAAHPGSTDFWLKMLQLRPPRDRFAEQRREIAVAALAHMFMVHDDPSSLDSLLSAAGDDSPTTRAAVAYYVARVLIETGRKPPEPAIEALHRLAREDRALEPRFIARAALHRMGRPLDPDHPDGSCTFRVWHTEHKSAYRIVELAFTHTLEDLHDIIQQAWDWDGDHLYAFYMNGVIYDERYAVGPAETLGVDVEAFDKVILLSDQIMLGQLGLGPGHRFAYLFDFGDSHRFDIVVADIKKRADVRHLPRIVKSVGRAMRQYPSW